MSDDRVHNVSMNTIVQKVNLGGDGNARDRPSIRKTKFLAAHFFTKQSQRCSVQRRSAPKPELGLAKRHLFPAAFASNQISSAPLKDPKSISLIASRAVSWAFLSDHFFFGQTDVDEKQNRDCWRSTPKSPRHKQGPIRDRRRDTTGLN